MKRIGIIIKVFLLMFIFVQCEKEDMYARFAPEILYMRAAITDKGQTVWEVSPDAMEITLKEGTNEWTVRARISAPNKLSEVCLVLADNPETMLETYKDFETNAHVKEIAYPLTGITSTTVVRIRAVDMVGNVTTRDFTIKIQ